MVADYPLPHKAGGTRQRRVKQYWSILTYWTFQAEKGPVAALQGALNMFGSIGMPELIIIMVIALIIFGPRKLPELGKSLGRSLNEFKKASTDLQNTLEQEIKIEEQKEQVKKNTDEEKTASSAFDTDHSKFDTDKKDDDQNTAPPRETVSRS